MVEGSFSEEFTSPVQPARLWKAAVLDFHNIFPKIAPQHIASVELSEDGGVGTIKTLNFTQAINGSTCTKNRVDVLDKRDFLLQILILEIGEKYESVCFEIEIKASADGGSAYKVSGEYKTVGDYVLPEAESKASKEGFIKVFKGIEAYLHVNPDAYA